MGTLPRAPKPCHLIRNPHLRPHSHEMSQDVTTGLGRPCRANQGRRTGPRCLPEKQGPSTMKSTKIALIRIQHAKVHICSSGEKTRQLGKQIKSEPACCRSPLCTEHLQECAEHLPHEESTCHLGRGHLQLCTKQPPLRTQHMFYNALLHMTMWYCVPQCTMIYHYIRLYHPALHYTIIRFCILVSTSTIMKAS